MSDTVKETLGIRKAELHQSCRVDGILSYQFWAPEQSLSECVCQWQKKSPSHSIYIHTVQTLRVQLMCTEPLWVHTEINDVAIISLCSDFFPTDSAHCIKLKKRWHKNGRYTAKSMLSFSFSTNLLILMKFSAIKSCVSINLCHSVSPHMTGSENWIFPSSLSVFTHSCFF